MKKLGHILLFCIFFAAILFGFASSCNAQLISQPTYTGSLDGNVWIPAVLKNGKSVKVSSIRFGASGSIDTMSNKDADIELTTGVGQLAPLILKNGYGFFTLTNNTVDTMSVENHFVVTYSDTAINFPVPVISVHAELRDDTSQIHATKLTPHFYDFDIELKGILLAGESVTVSYNVKGF